MLGVSIDIHLDIPAAVGYPLTGDKRIAAQTWPWLSAPLPNVTYSRPSVNEMNELALKATLEYFLIHKHVDTWAVTWLVAVPHVIPRVVISLRPQSMTLLLTLSAPMALMYSQESRFSMVCKKNKKQPEV